MSDEQKMKANSTQYVRLNVGGTLYFTTVRRYSKWDSFLKSLFTDGSAEVDTEGCTVIDRCGKHFGTILDFLKGGTVILPDTFKDVAELLVEAKFYKINELVTLCEKVLTKEERHNELICRVPIVTSGRETRFLINTTHKPVVKLLINRHNNKYSYTHMSDDNLLKNIELFDKLSLKHRGRILFIKDVDDISEQICSWTFFKDRTFCATVCCTFNVCETDRMYTKVEFPEAKINEETDLILRNIAM